ncbi:hypothetical protein D9613_009331 [Agrocybe pediades]|uniref:DUF6534 domain-containing protein n=1 Tax=Agrocybe pediades TaxID=84607 RepID=A0A8H4VUB2_9AGAR|nr:hypothetical protein D9613_009331 [Agrocybe pediades]
MPNELHPGRFIPGAETVFDVPSTLGAVFYTGAVLIGSFGSCVLYGLTAVQTWFYLVSYPKDPLRNKFLVGQRIHSIRPTLQLNTDSRSLRYGTRSSSKESLSWERQLTIFRLLDTLHTILTSYTAYFYLVSRYYSPSALLLINWSVESPSSSPTSLLWNVHRIILNLPDRSIPVSVAFSNTIEVIVQSYFLHKILLSESGVEDIVCYEGLRRLVSRGTLLWRTLVFLLGMLVLAHLGTAIEIAIVTFMAKAFGTLPQSKYYSAIPLAITNICANVLINGALIYLLRGHRSGIQRTDNIVKRLIIYAVNRCLLISCLEIVEIIVFSTSTHTLWYLGIDFVMAKLYANSLLASLNSRLGGVDISGRDTNPESSIRFSVLAPRTNATGIDIENSAVPSAQDDVMIQKTEKCVL